MDELSTSDDLQLARVKHYYHQQLQRKEDMILRLISRQKIILTDLRHQLDAVPAIAQNPIFMELNSKLERLEEEHTAVMKEYTKNHKYVALLMNSCSASSPVSLPKVAPHSLFSSENSISIRSQIPSMVNRDSVPANAASAPALTNALLSCPTSLTARHELKTPSATYGFPRSKSVTSACRVKDVSKHNENNNQQSSVTPPNGPSSDPSNSSSSPITPTHTVARTNSSGRQTAGCKLIKTLPSPIRCPFKTNYSSADDRSWTFSFNLPPSSVSTSYHQPASPHEAWSTSSINTNGITNAVEASDSLHSVDNAVLQSIHRSVVDPSNASTLPATPAWLTGSSPSDSDDVYAPAFDWNSSERLPDFSVLG